PLRLEFTARESLFFPPGKAANTLRGALGTEFSRLAGPYAKLFAPVAPPGGPSGLADPPRPFVFRARHLDGRAIQPGESFHFDLNVFTIDTAVLEYFVRAFSALASEGLGPGRGKADLRCVRRLAAAGLPEQIICGAVDPVALELDPRQSAPRTIRVEFLSPTELKHEDRIAPRPEFPILFSRLRDRISILRSLYGSGPLELDFQASGLRAAAVKMTACEVRRIETERRSTRTGQTHSIGGFVGMAEYEGDLAEFLPYLEVGRWTGVGRQSVWGKGEIRIADDQLG
ncbi:MAG TPA: CRISPR system precrRNA processing endoribonuclease RAMP protein Cas6, partial [Bryobacteraceae bacterium]